MAGASVRLRGKLRLLDGAVDAVYEELWGLPDPARVYPAFLILLHQMIRASVPLMETARVCAAERAAGDPVSMALVPYFDEHIVEERDHDRWLLDDLELTGVPRSQVLDRIPPPHVAALVGAQYYWIRHHHPLALLGYIAVLEGSPPGESFLVELQERTGFPEAAFYTMRKHGQIDPHHRDHLDHFIDSLPLTPAHESLLGVSLVHTMGALGSCVRALLPGKA